MSPEGSNATRPAGLLDRTSETITLEWYQQLTRWHRIIKDIELHGGIVDIPD
jgi:hypothetical protein